MPLGRIYNAKNGRKEKRKERRRENYITHQLPPCGLLPSGDLMTFHMGYLRPSENTDVYIIVHNRSKFRI